MSSSQAGSSHSSSWRIFSSARLVTFSLQLEKKNQLENWIFFSLFPLHFQKTSQFLVFFVVSLVFLHKMTDFLVQKPVNEKKRKKVLQKALNKKKSSLISAWKLKCPSSVCLSFAQNHYCSAWLSSGNSSSNSSLLFADKGREWHYHGVNKQYNPKVKESTNAFLHYFK